MKVLVPMKRDIRLWPPVISLIKGLLRLGHHVDHFSYYCSPETLASVKDEQGLHVETVSSEPYPGQQQLPVRALATWRARRGLVRFLAGHHDCDLIWLGEWDYPGIMRMVRRAGIRCPVVYQLHELNPRRFKPCRQVDYVVVPEENRAWLTKFGAGLDRLPLVLPNCPLDHPRRVAEHVDPVLEGLCRAGKRVVLCPGGVGVGGAGIHMRCILEMIEAMASTPKSFVLAIMPTATPDATTRSKLESHAAAHGVADRMVLLENRVAPEHMKVIGKAHIGIGLYRQTILNYVYCAPNRLYEVTGFGIPVILPDGPAICQLAARYAGIVPCRPDDPESIARAICSLDDPQAYQSACRGATEFFEDDGNYLDRLKTVLAQCVRT